MAGETQTAQTDERPKHAPGSQEAQHAIRNAAALRGLVVIRFLVGQPPYNAGESAGFPPEVANRYLNARIKTDNGTQQVAERVKAGKSYTLPGAQPQKLTQVADGDDE